MFGISDLPKFNYENGFECSSRAKLHVQYYFTIWVDLLLLLVDGSTSGNLTSLDIRMYKRQSFYSVIPHIVLNLHDILEWMELSTGI